MTEQTKEKTAPLQEAVKPSVSQGVSSDKLKELTTEMPYRWRVQSFSKNKPQASCVAYIDARDVMDKLDKVLGPENWQDDYKDLGGQLYAGIGININGEWTWRWDTGSESDIEKEKGLASDAFKRAAVKWGIGRFLYNLDVVYVKANETKGDRNKPFVVDDNGQKVWDLTEYINGLSGKRPKTSPQLPKPSVKAEQTRSSEAYASFVKSIKSAQNQETLDDIGKQITQSTKSLVGDELNELRKAWSKKSNDLTPSLPVIEQEPLGINEDEIV